MPARLTTPLSPAVWPWVIVSLLAHAIVLWVTFGLWGAGALTLGRGVPDGSGFGGRSVELEIRGDADEPATGALPGEGLRGATLPRIEERTVESASPSEAVSGDLAVDLRQGPRRRDPRPTSERGQEGAQRVPELEGMPRTGDSSDLASEDHSPGEGETSGGTDAEETTAGAQAGDPTRVILGAAGLGGSTVSARRALMPNGGACADPVAGTWRAQKFRSGDRTWVRFVLRIRRDADTNELRGSILSRIWSGTAARPVPGECTAFGMDHTWQMRARGHFDGQRMTFGSRSARLVRADCPSRDSRYAPDNFSGSVDVMREVFDSINNDGAFDIDEPYTFRRVSCE